MESRWSDDDAKQVVEAYAQEGVGADLAVRTFTARLLGTDPKLVLHGGGNTSVKTRMMDVYGDEIPVLCVKGSGWDLATIEPQGHPAVRLEPLHRLRRLASLSDEAMVNALRSNLLDSSAPNPSVETLLHVFFRISSSTIPIRSQRSRLPTSRTRKRFAAAHSAAGSRACPTSCPASSWPSSPPKYSTPTR